MKCNCGFTNCNHDPEFLLECQARKFIRDHAAGAYAWWEDWANKKHRHYRGEKYLARLRAKVKELRGDSK